MGKVFQVVEKYKLTFILAVMGNLWECCSLFKKILEILRIESVISKMMLEISKIALRLSKAMLQISNIKVYAISSISDKLILD